MSKKRTLKTIVVCREMNENKNTITVQLLKLISPTISVSIKRDYLDI